MVGLLNATAFHGASACWLSHMKQYTITITWWCNNTEHLPLVKQLAHGFKTAVAHSRRATNTNIFFYILYFMRVNAVWKSLCVRY